MNTKLSFTEFIKQLFTKQTIFHTVSIGVVTSLLASVFLFIVLCMSIGVQFNPIEAFLMNTLIAYAIAYMFYTEYVTLARNIKQENKPICQ